MRKISVQKLSNIKLICTLTFSLLIYSLPLKAQTLPNLPLPTQPEPQEPKPLPSLPPVLPRPENTNPSIPLLPAEIPGKIIIKRFEVIGNTVFPQAEIDRLLQPYILRPISFGELLAVQRVITQLYVDNGYINSGAFIPPQTIEDRVIKVQVIEGTVAEIQITGLKRLNSNYVRSRLERAVQSPLNQNKLLQALQLLQIDPLIANISAELSEGVDPGSSFLRVDITEADPIASKLSFDNQIVPTVSNNRRQIEINHSNLLGWGDRFNIAYINTQGSDALNNLSYTFPLNARNGTLELLYSLVDSQIIQENFRGFDIETETANFNLIYRQPLYQTSTREFVAGIIFARQDSQTTLGDQPFPLARGANDEGETKISAIRLFQEFIDRNEQEVLALRSQFSIGVDIFDATINDNLPDSEFFSWRGQAQYLRLLSPDTSILIRSDFQLAGEALVAIEQFSLGGGNSVRGFSQDMLLGDNGLLVSVELRHSFLRIARWNTTLQLIPFVDFGTVWNADDTELETNTLSSVGIGIKLLVGDSFNARLDWGIPLVEVDNLGDSLQENGIHFSLEFLPF